MKDAKHELTLENRSTIKCVIYRERLFQAYTNNLSARNTTYCNKTLLRNCINLSYQMELYSVVTFLNTYSFLLLFKLFISYRQCMVDLPLHGNMNNTIITLMVIPGIADFNFLKLKENN